MKKVKPTMLACLYCIFLLSINSCRKADDLKLILENGNEDLGKCSIQNMTQQLPSPVFPDVALSFAYNDRKDPVTITPSISNPYYSQWRFFYDTKGRMSQSVTIHADGTFDRWHVYFYDNKDRITGDSVYFSGQIGDRNTAASRSHSQLVYDHLNRIGKEIAGNFSVEYTYNADGNLSSKRTNDNGSVTVQDFQGYSRQLSVLLTNKIWRFLARDYSLNSLTEPFSVNDHRLPTIYRNSAGADIGTFFFVIYVNFQLTIVYDCPDKMEISE